jgi:hypothetical protein
MAMTWVPDQRGLPPRRPEARGLAAEADAAGVLHGVGSGCDNDASGIHDCSGPVGAPSDENGGHKGLRRFTPTIR